MEITQQTIGAVVAVKPGGPIIASSCDNLHEAVASLAKLAMGRVVMDMESVAFIDSKGIEALLDCSESLATLGMTLKLCSVNPTVCDALALTGNDAVFEFHLDAGTAARSFL